MWINTEEFLRAFYKDNNIYFRIFADRKATDDFKGKKITTTFDDLDKVTPPDTKTPMEHLRTQNEQKRGVFFVVNSGGHEDSDIKKINAIFFELDEGTFEEQLEKINAFPIKPSIIVVTQKSHHVYYLVNDVEVSEFRNIQKRLIKQFDSDPTIINESRVLRVPGFYHNKKETPVLVECIEFNPTLIYSKNDILPHLPELSEIPVEIKKSDNISRGQRGLPVLLKYCDFMDYCKSNSTKLPESDWYAMVTNLGVYQGGVYKIHELSQSYPKYSKTETDSKIKHFFESGSGPITCKTIWDKGFKCPKLGKCNCASPAGLPFTIYLKAKETAEFLNDYSVGEKRTENIEAAEEFLKEFFMVLPMNSIDAFMSDYLKPHFNKLIVKDLNKLVKFYKELKQGPKQETPLEDMTELQEALFEYKVSNKHQEKSEMAMIVIKWFMDHGAELFLFGDEVTMFFENRLCLVSSESLPFTSLLLKYGKLVSSDTLGKSIIAVMRDYAFLFGKKVTNTQWLYSDKKLNSIYLNLVNEENSILRMSPGEVKIIPNAKNEEHIILDIPNSAMLPIKYNPDVDINHGLELFKTLIIDNMTCDSNNAFMVGCWFISLFLKSYSSARPLLKCSGGSKAGKSTAAKLFSKLLYGKEMLSIATTAAMYSKGSKDPLIIIDNLESENMTKEDLRFFLTAVTGAVRSKRDMGSSTGTIDETVDSMCIITAIEPLPKKEIINRVFDIEFKEEYKTNEFIEDITLTEIEEHRDTILSAIFKLIAYDILPSIKEQRIHAITNIKTYGSHSKDRVNEYLSLMYVVAAHIKQRIPDVSRGDCWENMKEFIEYNEGKSDVTEAGTNPILNSLDGILKDIQAEALTEKSLKYNVKLLSTDGYVQGFVVTMRDLLECMNIYHKHIGTKCCYDKPAQLSERIKNDKEFLKLQGWIIEKKGMSSGYQKWELKKVEYEN